MTKILEVPNKYRLGHLETTAFEVDPVAFKHITDQNPDGIVSTPIDQAIDLMGDLLSFVPDNAEIIYQTASKYRISFKEASLIVFLKSKLDCKVIDLQRD